MVVRAAVALFLALGSMNAVAQGPGLGPWRQYASPEDAGFSSDALDAANTSASELGSAAVLIVRDGAVVQAWGTVDHPYRTHSMRKSLYSVTFGTMLGEGVDLDATLAEVGINDLTPLTVEEQQATVRDLLCARSGVYLNAAYETDSNADRRPERGSHAPGTFWYYNNWDFNALPTVFVRQTGQAIDDVFSSRVAAPLGMEDFEQNRDVFAWLEPSVSAHPAVLIRISARDLARVGQLVLQNGSWDGAQIVPASWIEDSTHAHTTFDDGHYRGAGNGYGYLWWVFPGDPDAGSEWQRLDRIAALGAGGHAMFIVPELDLLIVHRTDTDRGPGVSDRQGAALMDEIVQAIVGDVREDALLVDVETRPLGATPPPLARDWAPVPAKLIATLVGRYVDAQGAEFDLFEYDGRLFARRQSGSSSEAELFLNAEGDLISPIAPFRLRAGEQVDGRAQSVTIWFRGREMRLNRPEE
jgi:CubicO group peptidase (beta-lactamase class C family)